MATLPPWLDVTPGTYLQAAEAGGRFGEEAANRSEQFREFNENLGLKREEMAQDAALKAQEMGMRMQDQKIKLAEFMNNLKQQGLENQLKVDKLQSDKNIAEQTLAVDKHFKEQQMDWRKQQTDLMQQKAAQQAQVAAAKFAAQQEASQRIAGGEDAGKVLLELGPRIQESGTSLFDFYKSQQAKPTMFAPYMDEVDGQRVFVSPDRYGNPSYKFPPADRGAANVDQNRIKALTARESSLMKDLDVQTEGSPSNLKLKAIQAELDKALGISPTGTNAPAGGAGPNIRNFNFNVRPAGEAPAESGAAPATAPHTEEQDTTAPTNAPAGDQRPPNTYLQNLLKSKDLTDLLKDANKVGRNAKLDADGNIIMDFPDAFGRVVSRPQLEEEVYNEFRQRGW